MELHKAFATERNDIYLASVGVLIQDKSTPWLLSASSMLDRMASRSAVKFGARDYEINGLGLTGQVLKEVVAAGELQRQQQLAAARR